MFYFGIHYIFCNSLQEYWENYVVFARNGLVFQCGVSVQWSLLALARGDKGPEKDKLRSLAVK